MVSSLPLIESQTTPVLSNVSKLNADIHRLAKLGANFTGDANQLASLDASVTVLKSDILKTTSSVKHSHLFNYDESVLITSALRDLARPVIQVLLDLIANVSKAGEKTLSFTSLLNIETYHHQTRGSFGSRPTCSIGTPR